MSVTCSFRVGNTVVETLSTNVQGASTPTVTHSAYDESLSLDSLGTGGTPPITYGKAFLFTLVAGIYTIDFTALPATGGGTFSATGLRLITALFKNPTTNSALINIAPGASNGLRLWGAGNDIDLHLGAKINYYSNDQGEDIDGTHKTIDLAGSGTDVLQCVFTFG